MYNERQAGWKESFACEKASTPFFKAFAAAEPLSRRYLLPPDHWIGFRPSFKAMWTDSNKSITQAVWDKHLPSLRKDFDRHAERTRIQAIRFILSAQRDVPISTLSRRPSDYPESAYNSQFFSRVTSLLTTLTYRSGQPLAAVSVYPSIGSFGKNYHGRQLEKGTGYRQVALLREIAKAAGLDLESATHKDLGNLNGYFIWVDHPKKKQRNQHYSWMWLVRFPLSRLLTVSRRPADTLLSLDSSALLSVLHLALLRSEQVKSPSSSLSLLKPKKPSGRLRSGKQVVL